MLKLVLTGSLPNLILPCHAFPARYQSKRHSLAVGIISAPQFKTLHKIVNEIKVRWFIDAQRKTSKAKSTNSEPRIGNSKIKRNYKNWSNNNLTNMFKNSSKKVPQTRLVIYPTTLAKKITARIYRGLMVSTLTIISSGMLLERQKLQSIDFCSKDKKLSSLSLSSEA